MRTSVHNPHSVWDRSAVLPGPAHLTTSPSLRAFRNAVRQRDRARQALAAAEEELLHQARAVLEQGTTVSELAAVSGLGRRTFYELADRNQLVSGRKRAGLASQLGAGPESQLRVEAERLPAVDIPAAYERAQQLHRVLQARAVGLQGFELTRAEREEIALSVVTGERIADLVFHGGLEPVYEVIRDPGKLAGMIDAARRAVAVRRREGQQAGGASSLALQRARRDASAG